MTTPSVARDGVSDTGVVRLPETLNSLTLFKSYYGLLLVVALVSTQVSYRRGNDKKTP